MEWDQKKQLNLQTNDPFRTFSVGLMNFLILLVLTSVKSAILSKQICGKNVKVTEKVIKCETYSTFPDYKITKNSYEGSLTFHHPT